jgi:putative acetyltransferase
MWRKLMSIHFDDWKIEAVSPHANAALSLVARLSEELAERYQADGSGQFAPGDVLVPRSGFLVGMLGSRPVACGAYRPIDSDVVEIKRMYVQREHRGHGFGRRILDDLEARAHRDGYTTVRLEDRQFTARSHPAL